MSIQKIAKLAGVSVATVSRVINHSGSVKEVNRDKVLKAIEASNYQPNLLARQLRTARSSMVLVLVSDISNPFCAEIVKGIEEQAEQNGYRILLCNAGGDINRSRSSLQLLAGKVVDGVITMDAFTRLPELTQLIGEMPWVQCAEYADSGDISCVGINDTDAARQLVAHLAEGGHRHIALINHDLSYKYAQLRQQGYQQELKRQGLSWQAIGYASDLSFSAGKQAMQALLKGATRPDAVFAVSDTLAAGAMSAIESAGLRIPQDIAVAGFDGTELAEIVSPPLTTVAQPSRAIGRTAFDLLLKKIADPQAPTERVMMAWRLILRASA